MGLTVDVIEFPSAPPSERELLEHLRERVGDETGVESLRSEGRRATLSCLFDPYTRPYALQFLASRGGVLVDRVSGVSIPMLLPEYVSRAWRSLPWWRRAWLRARS
jgi:hypothetical protein